MGLVRLLTIRHYCWKFKKLHSSVVRNLMSNMRFEFLLNLCHFDDCLIQKYQEIYTPGKVGRIDESLVPFRRTLIKKQYISQKNHKYAVKLFKLCCERVISETTKYTLVKNRI